MYIKNVNLLQCNKKLFTKYVVRLPIQHVSKFDHDCTTAVCLQSQSTIVVLTLHPAVPSNIRIHNLVVQPYAG